MYITCVLQPAVVSDASSLRKSILCRCTGLWVDRVGDKHRNAFLAHGNVSDLLDKPWCSHTSICNGSSTLSSSNTPFVHLPCNMHGFAGQGHLTYTHTSRMNVNPWRGKNSQQYRNIGTSVYILRSCLQHPVIRRVAGGPRLTYQAFSISHDVYVRHYASKRPLKYLRSLRV